jgi:hypothetical protein
MVHRQDADSIGMSCIYREQLDTGAFELLEQIPWRI